MRRVLLIYNTDYDQELVAAAGVDASAVGESAHAVCQGISDYGLPAEILGVHGQDVSELLCRLQHDKFDLIFNIVESLCGDTRNELVLPALLDLLKIPYTGPDAIAIGLCLNKHKCKQMLAGCGVSTPDHVLISSLEELTSGALDISLANLRYPLLLKLVREDASIGIDATNKVDGPTALKARAYELLCQFRQPVLAERFIAGREVNVSVMGNGGDLFILPLHEIDFSRMPAGRPHIISYAGKWDEDHVDYDGTRPILMKDVSSELRREISTTAMAAFRALGLRDFARIDLRIDSDGKAWVIDVNPNCDLSPDAGVARAAAHRSWDYPGLVGKICELAWKRYGSNNTFT